MSESNDLAYYHINELSKILKEEVKDCLLYSCTKCPINFIKDKYRYQIVIKFYDNNETREFIRKLQKLIKDYDLPKNVYCDIYLNPKNMA